MLHQVPTDHYMGEGCLALPKLNMQFLSFHDYLMRNFHLFRLEATYEIQEDIADVVGRMGAYLDEEDRPCFKGWARMAIPLSAFRITEVCTFSVCYALFGRGLCQAVKFQPSGPDST